MIVGILAGIALPAIQYAVLKADAAHMVADAHTVSLAAYAHLSENGRFPGSGGYGTAPPELASHLPEGFQFTYKGVQYMWWSLNFSSPNNFWKTRTLGLFVINYSNRKDLSDPMYSYNGPDAYWSGSYFYFLYRG